LVGVGAGCAGVSPPLPLPPHPPPGTQARTLRHGHQKKTSRLYILHSMFIPVKFKKGLNSFCVCATRTWIELFSVNADPELD